MRSGSEGRFWWKVRVCEHAAGMRRGEHYLACRGCCWLWEGYRDGNGYGRTRYILEAREEVYVHRVAWAFAHGGMNPRRDREVAHCCDVRACCNPRHLWLAEHGENIADRDEKGRQARGNMLRRPGKLGWKKARRIRELRRAGLSQREIAAVMGCTQVMVCHVMKGRSWPEAADPGLSAH